jgi:hypothetical protein
MKATETGLHVYPATFKDSNIIADKTEDVLTREWDMETRSWFFPEEPETYDALEEEINSILAGSGADYRIEGIF